MGDILANLIRFIFLLALQVALFNHINLFGYVNAYPYLLFILLYPISGNKNLLLLLSFILGLVLDLFSNSGGVHAVACLTVAYIRPQLFKFSFGISYEYNTIKIMSKMTSERITLLVSAITIHHLVLFILEYFRFSLILDIFLQSVLTSILTIMVSLLMFYIFKPIKKRLESKYFRCSLFLEH